MLTPIRFSLDQINCVCLGNHQAERGIFCYKSSHKLDHTHEMLLALSSMSNFAITCFLNRDLTVFLETFA